MSQLILDALTRLAPRLSEGGVAVKDLQRLSGGASMETWAFAVVGGSIRRDLILRRREEAPDEATSRAIPLAAEAALITAAKAAGAPVATVVHVAVPQDGLAEALITERVMGEALGRKIVADPRFDGVRPGLAAQCGEVLARIHRMPIPDVGLKVFDARADLDYYEAVYRGTGAQRPVLELAFQHLRAKLPPATPLTVVHSDFRNGNLMVDETKGVAAVLDWEIAHLGDPAEDLGWLCVNSWRFGRADKPVGGFGRYEDLLEGYERAGGQGMTLSRLLYYQALGSLRWGIMCLIMYGHYANGANRSVERPMIGRRVSETEIDLLHLLETGL